VPMLPSAGPVIPLRTLQKLLRAMQRNIPVPISYLDNVVGSSKP